MPHKKLVLAEELGLEDESVKLVCAECGQLKFTVAPVLADTLTSMHLWCMVCGDSTFSCYKGQLSNEHEEEQDEFVI